MKRVLVNSLILVALGTLSAAAVAQYKWRTPEGKTVYSDVPPPTGAKLMNDRTSDQPEAATTLASAGAAGAPAAVELPYELKMVNSKFPVVLYTAPECVPCAAARQHLGSRGVPFSEKSISTSADFDVFKTRGFSENSFPALTVGREKTVGFESGAYDRLLTAAGYPRTSKLPPNYKQAAAEPMTQPQPRKLTVTVQQPGQPADASASVADNPSAIEVYRRQVQAGSANDASDSGPSMRF